MPPACAGVVAVTEATVDAAAAAAEGATAEDVEAVTALLGRRPQGAFRVARRDRDGGPLVIENAPLLDDGTPMPTRYWLVGRRAVQEVSRLESQGGARRAEREVPPAAVADAHARHAAARDALVAQDRPGPRPSGGVGGTRRGVKCLHAHLAWHLVGGDDPVGRWTARQLAAAGADIGVDLAADLEPPQGAAT